MGSSRHSRVAAAAAIRCTAAACLLLVGAAWAQPKPKSSRGRFIRTVWVGRRFRVNSPDAATGRFKNRPEVKAKGRIVIPVRDDLRRCTAAELYLELWGGHPGTAKKSLTLNGKSSYDVPEVGTAEMNCTYSYPVIPLKAAELVRGRNVFQFTCERGRSFWGHYIIDNACLRLTLRPDHPEVAEAGLSDFTAAVRAAPGRGETIELGLQCPPRDAKRFASVEYWGRYDGYDENGDGRANDWHGFTKGQKTVAMSVIGVSSKPPFAATWDVSMVPDQQGMAVRAVVRFRGRDDLVYRTAAVGGLATPKRAARVKLYAPASLPRPFWSRAKRVRRCTIDLDARPGELERAELHVTIWDGGRGKTREPFTLNGRALPVAGGGRHDLICRRLRVDPAILRKGANEVRLLSDTSHHGIEVCLPGPALMVRTKGR